MRSEIRVVADNGQEFKFDLDQATPLTPQAGREWLDAEFTRLECEPLRPTGKLLLADKVLVLARDAGAVCGLIALDFMYYLPLGTTTCRVTALVVTPTAQGLGIGRALLKEAERRARVGGAARIELTSGAQRTEAHAFYRACGYKDSSVRFVKLLGA